MSASKITAKGQITVPKVVREALALGPGDRIAFHIHDDGTVTVEAETVELHTLRGVLKSGRRHVSLEQMNEAVRQSAARR